MNIYFACSITGGRQFEPVYQSIVAYLEKLGHFIPTSHLAESEIMDLEKTILPVDVYTRDIKWIDEAELLIAEVSTPSHGVGYEIAYALSVGKPVLCCYHIDAVVSKMITGNTHPNITVRSYSDEKEVFAKIEEYLSQKIERL